MRTKMTSDTGVYQNLKNEILELKFRPGELLQEVQLGERYGASRTPAREALRTLIAEGLVNRAGRFYYVKHFTIAEVRELYELREIVECASVRLAAERAPEYDLKDLLNRLEKHYHKVSPAELYNIYSTDASAFHLRIAELCGNSLILQQLRIIHDKVIFISRLVDMARREEFYKSLQDHFRIADALLRRNADAAEAECRAHIRYGVVMYERCYEELGADSGVDGAKMAQAAIP